MPESVHAAFAFVGRWITPGLCVLIIGLLSWGWKMQSDFNAAQIKALQATVDQTQKSTQTIMLQLATIQQQVLTGQTNYALATDELRGLKKSTTTLDHRLTIIEAQWRQHFPNDD